MKLQNTSLLRTVFCVLTVAGGCPDLRGQNVVPALNHYRPSVGVRVEIGSSPATAFAFDGQHMWVGYANGITKFRVSDNAVVRQIAMRSTPLSMCWDGSSLWIVDGTTLTRDTGAGVYSYSVPLGSPTAVAFDGEFLYVAGGKPGTSVITLFRMSDLQDPVGPPGTPQNPIAAQSFSFPIPNTQPVTLLPSPGGVYVGTDGGLFLIEPRSGTHSIELLHSSPIQALACHGGAAYWVAGRTRFLRRHTRISTGETASFPDFLEEVPVSLASDGVTLWAVYANGQVQTLSNLKKYTIGGSPSIAAFDGAHMWVGNGALTTRGLKAYVNKM